MLEADAALGLGKAIQHVAAGCPQIFDRPG